MLRNLERLESKENQPLGLSDVAKKIFIDLNGKYKIPVKDTAYSIFKGAGAGRKLTSKELMEITFFLIIVILAYICFKIIKENL